MPLPEGKVAEVMPSPALDWFLYASLWATRVWLLLELGSLTWLLANLRGLGPWRIKFQRGCRRQTLGPTHQLCVLILHFLLGLKLHKPAEREEGPGSAEVRPIRRPGTSKELLTDDQITILRKPPKVPMESLHLQMSPRKLVKKMNIEFVSFSRTEP